MSQWRFAVCAPALERAAGTAAVLASHRVKAIEAGPAFFLAAGPAELRAAGDALRAEGIELRSVHAPFRGEWQLAEADETRRPLMLEYFRRFLSAVSTAGGRIVVLHAGARTPAAEQPAALDRAFDALAELAPMAGDLGLTLALENLPLEWPGSNPADLAARAAALNHRAVGLCLDTGHAHLTTGVAAALAAMGPHIVTFHVHDNDGRSDIHLAPPFGTIDWGAFVAGVEALGWDEPLTLECSPWGDELIAGGPGLEADYSRLIDTTRELLDGWSARLGIARRERAADPSWHHRANLPHAADLR